MMARWWPVEQQQIFNIITDPLTKVFLGTPAVSITLKCSWQVIKTDSPRNVRLHLDSVRIFLIRLLRSSSVVSRDWLVVMLHLVSAGGWSWLTVASITLNHLLHTSHLFLLSLTMYTHSILYLQDSHWYRIMIRCVTHLKCLYIVCRVSIAMSPRVTRHCALVHVMRCSRAWLSDDSSTDQLDTLSSSLATSLVVHWPLIGQWGFSSAITSSYNHWDNDDWYLSWRMVLDSLDLLLGGGTGARSLLSDGSTSVWKNLPWCFLTNRGLFSTGSDWSPQLSVSRVWLFSSRVFWINQSEISIDLCQPIRD